MKRFLPLLLAASLSTGLLGNCIAAAQRGGSAGVSIFTLKDVTVKINYSEKAQQLLTERDEVVVVAAYLTAHPRSDTPKKFINQNGIMILGQESIETTSGVNAVFHGLSMDGYKYPFIDAAGPQLLINVYSGRRNSDHNYLRCTTEQGPFDHYKGKMITIDCKLFGE